MTIPCAADDVERVVVRVAHQGANTVDNRDMPDICMQHMCAVMLLDGTVSVQVLSDERACAIGGSSLRGDACELQGDDAMSAAHAEPPGHRRDRARRRRACVTTRGRARHPENPDDARRGRQRKLLIFSRRRSGRQALDKLCDGGVETWTRSDDVRSSARCLAVLRDFIWRFNESHRRIIALKVDDLKRTTQFYEKVFGFKVAKTGKVRDHTSRHLSDGVIDLSIMQYDAGTQSAESKAAGEGPCIHHFAVEVDDLASAEKADPRLRLRDHQRSGRNPGEVPRARRHRLRDRAEAALQETRARKK